MVLAIQARLQMTSEFGIQTRTLRRLVHEGHENGYSRNAILSTAKSCSQADIQTPEKNNSDMLRSKVRNVFATVETRLLEKKLSAMDKLVIRWMDPVMRSVGISSSRNSSSASNVVWNPDHRDLSGDTNGTQMTSWSRFNSNAHSNGIDDTRANFDLEEGDLLVGEKIPTWKHTLITGRLHDFYYIVNTVVIHPTLVTGARMVIHP